MPPPLAPLFFPRRLQPPSDQRSQPASPQRKRVGSGAWGFCWRLSSQAETMSYWRGCRVAPIFFWVVTLRYFQDEGGVRGVFAELEERSLVRRKVTVFFFGCIFWAIWRGFWTKRIARESIDTQKKDVLFTAHIGKERASGHHMDCCSLGTQAPQKPGHWNQHQRFCWWVFFSVHKHHLYSCKLF